VHARPDAERHYRDADSASRAGGFPLSAGPLFTDLLLVDEINRAPAKTQAALLEAMQEQAATVDGIRYALGEWFTVLATQNPIEQEGTIVRPAYCERTGWRRRPTSARMQAAYA